ncbi:hypothetical protein C8R48DRAFT_360427 [Suillus tomentosus]|nr:hypothetical protein C8R48DRAFT_360427 [Suillus tomentosus]
MRHSFRVVAVAAALGVSMAVSADSECQYAGGLCTTEDCCPGNACMPNEADPEVSMSDLIQDLWTHRRGRDHLYACEIGWTI